MAGYPRSELRLCNQKRPNGLRLQTGPYSRDHRGYVTGLVLLQSQKSQHYSNTIREPQQNIPTHLYLVLSHSNLEKSQGFGLFILLAWSRQQEPALSERACPV